MRSSARRFPAVTGSRRHFSPVGAWLSLVEHSVRDRGVGGSNPLAPTNFHHPVCNVCATGRISRGAPAAPLLFCKLMTDVPVSVGVKSGFTVLGWIKSWWQRPILEVSAEPRGPWTVRTELAGLPGVAQIEAANRATNYYRVRIRNRGSTVARGVRVSLDAIFYVDRSVWRELAAWEPSDLVWALRPGEASLTLAAEEAGFCDLGHTVSNYVQNNFLLSTARRVIHGLAGSWP